MSKQLRRWSHGFIQNVRIHWRSLLRQPFLRTTVAIALWDAVIAALAYLLVIPVLAIVVSPWFLLAYLIDAPAVAVPVLAKAIARREPIRALASIPAFFVLRTANAVFMLRAFWNEFIINRPLTVYEKGH